MPKNDRNLPESAQAKAATGKKRYATPKLETYGDIRDLTLGGSLSGVESGMKSKRT